MATMSGHPENARVPPSQIGAVIDTPAVRQAGRDALSLALMDTRNHTLALLAHGEAASASAGQMLGGMHGDPLWLAGHAGWFAEYWIGRNTQRHQGPNCQARPTRVPSVDPRADAWWGEASRSLAASDLPGAATTRAYLLEQLESTLDLLEKSPDDDAGLYFYRLALLHEDMVRESMLVQAQHAGLLLAVQLPAARRPLAPIGLPATRWTLGATPGGFVFDAEKWLHDVQLPEFEIDAQPVSWSQFVEFVDDGGYDRPECWRADGWAWLQALAEGDGRRGPRYVEQIGVASGAVLQQRFGRRVRVAGAQPAMHLSWWEADAWCRWAGRRLPGEAEWEYAACTAQRRGFDWGGVHEWTAGSLQPWPGYAPDPWDGYSTPFMGRARVLRGASWATPARLRDARFRSFALPDDDLRFVGFRSCAV
jgi:iron(II)-dependent oxidoreductase